MRTRKFTSTLRQYRGTKGRLKTRVARTGFEARVMEHLDFRHVTYTYEGEKILQKALPNCNFVW